MNCQGSGGRIALFSTPTQGIFRRVAAGNPFYVISAGLLLYGMNEVTTNPYWTGVEVLILRFNFCALILYELLLVGTAIALARRRVRYEAFLLFALSNVFVIVPFSLISRAAPLDDQLAWGMSFMGILLACMKFAAFGKFIPEFRIGRRASVFGAVLLVANAFAPSTFKQLAGNPADMKFLLETAWLGVLPALAACCNLVSSTTGIRSENVCEGHRLPFLLGVAWILVTVCHLGGIGYAAGFQWELSYLVPVSWVVMATLLLRRRDFLKETNRTIEEVWLWLILLLPLAAMNDRWISVVSTAANLVLFAGRCARRDRGPLETVRTMAAVVLFVAFFPREWLASWIPAFSRAALNVLCLGLFLSCIVFLSRDPRIAALVAAGAVACSLAAFQHLPLAVADFILLFLLAHSVRWEEAKHRGAGLFQILTGIAWVLVSTIWIQNSPHARWLVYSGGLVLLILFWCCILRRNSTKPWILPVSAVSAVLAEPCLVIGRAAIGLSPGISAIAAGFALFGLGSLIAFSKRYTEEGPGEKGGTSRQN